MEEKSKFSFRYASVKYTGKYGYFVQSVKRLAVSYMMTLKSAHLVLNSFSHLFFLVHIYQIVGSLTVLASESLTMLQAFEELWGEGMWSCQSELIIINAP